MQTAARLCVWLALCALAAVLLAPQPGRAQYPGPQSELPMMKARADELRDPKANIPDNPTLLDREYNRVDQEIDRYAIYASDMPGQEDALAKIEDIRAGIARFAQTVLALNCERQLADYRATYDTLGDIAFKLNAVFSGNLFSLQNEIDLHVLGNLPGIRGGPPQSDADVLSDCRENKRQLQNPATLAAINQSLDQLKAKVTERVHQTEEVKTTAAALINLLKQRRAAVQEKISSTSPQQQVANYLWIIMIVIGGSSVLTILVIWLFAEPVQMEWVISGQVIQFVTVMILLSVIMALGLSGILKENTLGTLLGGIAGYILAQGVGRAAAREATRRAGDSRMNPQPPPSTAAPPRAPAGGTPPATPQPAAE